MVPGVVIDHIPAATGHYIGSPGIAILPDGTYVASHDFFGPSSTSSRTLVFGSSDRGQSWRPLADIEGQFWSSLFLHDGALYLLGTDRVYGRAVIRRSGDGGTTWTTPADAGSGVLLADEPYHCAPVPVVVHAGRLWRAMEDAKGPGGWGRHFRAFMMSAPVGSDLLQASSWTCSDALERDPALLGGAFGGWLEGNALVLPSGGIGNVLRVDYREGTSEKAAIVEISEDGTAASFAPETGLVDFPGGGTKFTIRHDPISVRYWSLCNHTPRPEDGRLGLRGRNTLALSRSDDLRAWEVRSILLHHPDDEHHAFQYVDWLFDGDDIVAASRTAFDDGLSGAHNYHDANFLTFHRVSGFRDLTTDGPGTAA